MKPAGKARHDSLYFNYPQFDFARPPEMDGADPCHAVLIAGAGPVGLIAAIALARRGIASVVVDDKSSVSDGSRALCLSRHSMETLRQLGAEQPFLDKALGWTRGRCYFRDREFHRFEMSHSADERFLPMYNLQQQYIEKFLVDAARQYPELIDLRWQSSVTGVEAGTADVRLQVQTPQGAYALHGSYLLSADGARSQVRKSLGLMLNGANLPGDYVIVDVRMEHDFPTERRSFFESSANPEATILIHRQPDTIWRLDYQLAPAADREAALTEPTIRRSVQAILDMIGYGGDWELEWWSIYTANTLCLDDYRHGRVLFIGDAAHIVPIFGVRGLNNGIEDACNAAWKLAYVLQGVAEDAILDSYTPERRGATQDVFLNAGKSARFMTPPTRGYATLRTAVLELALTEDFCKPFADPRQVQPYTYRASPLNGFAHRDAEFKSGPAVGTPLPNRRIGEEDFLLDQLEDGFCGLYFSSDGSVPTQLQQVFAEHSHVKALIVARVAADRTGVVDADGRIAEFFGAATSSLYLIRPDRYIAARWSHLDVDELRTALAIACGRNMT